MALTPAEKQRRYRERLKAKEKTAPEVTSDFLQRPFSDYVAAHENEYQDVWYPLEWAGIRADAIPFFEADDDPDHDPNSDGPNRGSIGRAERMVGMLLDAAIGLAGMINRYKREQIDAAITQLEAGDLTNPAIRKQALADIVRLRRINDRLNKDVRRTLPEWKVKGE